MLFIVSSGYSTDPVPAGFEQYCFTECPAKPYGIEEPRKKDRRCNFKEK